MPNLFSRARLSSLAVMGALGFMSVAQPVVAAGAEPPVLNDSFRQSAEALRKQMATGGNASGVGSALALLQSANQPFEKYVAGELLLQATSGGADLRNQRIALGVILESGALPAKNVPELRALAGIISAILGEFKDAAGQIRYANTLGYASAPSQIALAESLFAMGDVEGGNNAFKQALDLRTKAGQQIDQSWYDRAIALSYQRKRPDLAAQWTQTKLAQTNPQPMAWRSGIMNYIAGAAPGPEQSLDLYRLMAATGALANGQDWVEYSGLAERKMEFAEALSALESANRLGGLPLASTVVAKKIAVLKPKAARDLATRTALANKAKAGNAIAALDAGDAAFSAANYAPAAELYKLAISRGSTDARATVRLGIALARSGDLAGGKNMLASVTDPLWQPVAEFWQAWVDVQGQRNPA